MSRVIAALRAGTAITLVLAFVGPTAAAAEDQRHVSYVPPIDAPIVDGFRPPASQYGSGNRGIDYAAEEGAEVRAAAPGRVVFAGRIGPQFHVTLLHDDGIRTSYSFLRSTSLRRGQSVTQGEVVGTAAGAIHFGARAGTAYLDPTDLFAGELPAIRLVPVEELPPVSEERRSIMEMIGAFGRGAASAAAVAARQATEAVAALAPEAENRLRLALHYVRQLAPPLAYADLLLEVNAAFVDYAGHSATCTPPEVSPPDPPEGRRIAVLVGGLGSSSAALRNRKGIAGVDTGALGFAPGDTYFFSYQGGHVGERGYGPEDTQNGFEESGAKLSALLSRLRRDNPGVPISLIAHSQGGLVARAALARGGSGVGGVRDLITLATPHHGSDVATGLAAVRTTSAQPLLDAAGSVLAGVDPGSEAVQQLSETSAFIRSLPAVPPEVRFTSIAAAGDLIVAPPRARVEGADNRIVSPAAGLNDHDALPRHPSALREMALALGGRQETCKSPAEFVFERLRGHVTALGTDVLAAALATRLPGGPVAVRR